jgi:hypothetical protein
MLQPYSIKNDIIGMDAQIITDYHSVLIINKDNIIKFKLFFT